MPCSNLPQATCLAVLIVCPLAAAEPPAPERRVPVIYGTDLFHPHDDPDDHYDLATLLAIPEFEIKAVLLDLGDRQKQRPGRIPLEQMFRITGRSAPYASGLSAPLKSADDRGLDRPADDQRAIELLLKTLRESRQPVTVITAGSVRDLTAAYRREPELLRKKASRIYINIGSADDSVEWNVKLDLHAYRALMASDLPIYWCPCMPTSGHRHSTYWKFRQSAVLDGLPRPLLNYFVYALQRVPPGELDPVEAIDGNLAPFRHLPGLIDRNMWCTASFLHAAGYGVKATANGFEPTPDRREATGNAVFTFVPARVEIDEAGRTGRIAERAEATTRVFLAVDNAAYQKAMTDCLRSLLKNMTIRRPAR